MEEPVVKSLSRLFLVALLTTLATGCVYVNGDKINNDDWKDTQVTNREAISQLDMGLSTQAVKDQLGAPADSEDPVYTAEAITSASGFLGIDGIFRFNEDGTAERGLAILEVTPEEFRVISSAPSSFAKGTN